MSVNSFLKERATLNIIENVASFCSECYSPLTENQIVFYDMKHCCYLCFSCQESVENELQKHSKSLDENNTTYSRLFS